MTFDDWWGAYPTQEDYEANCRDAWDASAASRDAEVSNLRQQMKLLREFVKLLRDYIPASAVGSMTVQEALTATEPNLQQSRRFTDPVTDDDFLHMINESNFAQERE